MKQNLMLIIMSLLSILFMTFHLTDDTLRARAGTPEAGGLTLIAVPIWWSGCMELWYLPNDGRDMSSC